MHVWFGSSYYSNIYKGPLDVQGYWQGASLAADPLQITVSNQQVLGMACIFAEKLHSLRLGMEIKGLKGINFCYFTGKLTEARKHTDMVKKKNRNMYNFPIFPFLWYGTCRRTRNGGTRVKSGGVRVTGTRPTCEIILSYYWFTQDAILKKEVNL